MLKISNELTTKSNNVLSVGDTYFSDVDGGINFMVVQCGEKYAVISLDTGRVSKAWCSSLEMLTRVVGTDIALTNCELIVHAK